MIYSYNSNPLSIFVNFLAILKKNAVQKVAQFTLYKLLLL